MTDPFDSSDSHRGDGMSPEARLAALEGELRLERGGALPGVQVAYETYGRLNGRGDNAVLICHALTGDSHVASHHPEDSPGWWEPVVGPGKPIDTDRYFVICHNILGGCQGTTGPNSINPETGRPYGADFPLITIADMVEVQKRLLDQLAIAKLLAVIGGSLGGHQALTWATRYPGFARGCIALASSPRLTSQALAFDVVGRNSITRDPHYHGGQYYDQPTKPVVGLALARMLGHITYLSREAMRDKFDTDRLQPRDIATDFEKTFSVGSYLAHQGDKFVDRFDANSYLALSMAMDLFDLGDTPDLLRKAFASCDCRWLLLSFSSDWLFPPFQSLQIVNALIADAQPVSYCNIESSCGHDAFLLENDLPKYGRLIAGFLANLDDHDSDPSAARPAPVRDNPRSIFHGHRLDHGQILELIPSGASVLDVGCGQGDLLMRIRDSGLHRIMGAEVDEMAVTVAVERGLDVVLVAADSPLDSFGDAQFDIVVLSQTLQSISDTEGIIRAIIRVGRQAIVSFPNLAYHRLRRMLAEEGRSPKAAGSYPHEWYNTPNRRFPTILDFEEFCQAKGVRIHERIYFDTQTHRQITDDPNLNADTAVFVISQ
jgi:homoserine O-acetyltransferase